MFKFIIKEISKEQALDMIRKYHYSNTLPRLNKHFIGFYLDDNLVGVVTLGWGTRPKHTIQKLFPSLDTKDYFEIGRMCMTEEMPRNSESQMLSQLIQYIKNNFKEIKVLFTWADGMLGKAGYVYQASNFLYAGYSETDIYLKDGVKIHPRQTKSIFGVKGDKRKSIRPKLNQMFICNIEHYRGRQFRYVKFICSKTIKKKLMKECLEDLNLNYPKEKDLSWKKQDLNTKKWVMTGKPPYKTDMKDKDNNVAIEDIKEKIEYIRNIARNIISKIDITANYIEVPIKYKNQYIREVILDELKNNNINYDIGIVENSFYFKKNN